MFDPQSQSDLKAEITRSIEQDRMVLDQLRQEIRSFRNATRKIQPRSTTSISLVATDGGNNRLQFDPFLVQIVRVVDSSNNELCLEAITPTTQTSYLSAKQFNKDGIPTTDLGKMMKYLGVKSLDELSPMIQSDDKLRPPSPSWVQVYRELVEWAVLFDIVRSKDFGTDTMIVFDGLLRSKVFAQDLFSKLMTGFREAIEQHFKKKRRIYLTGVAKHSQVYTRYRLAMALEGVLATDYPAYIEIPREIEKKAYRWAEFARGSEDQGEGEINKFVGGKMFFVKFGSKPRDPVWPIDIFESQKSDAQTILGCMLADAINGFPVPFYPQCLQRAHENAALVGFDFDILQDYIFEGVRGLLGDQAPALDVFRLQDADPAQRRYE